MPQVIARRIREALSVSDYPYNTGRASSEGVRHHFFRRAFFSFTKGLAAADKTFSTWSPITGIYYGEQLMAHLVVKLAKAYNASLGMEH